MEKKKKGGGQKQQNRKETRKIVENRPKKKIKGKGKETQIR